ncbi:hypothetical protein GPECTOR_7g939 [Gonium pectorale]|uniref:Uncharacterized protein n=1 Tax=Gonium pectorale TaxID=33097 RepID=A0A150GUH4_GONPE|nr:hypothetical protein GPECTOR_7g939 [Gonium pectorale]|eukprot:KXZ53489.1 hypothetical protein GPECTOR_7g939 [Gonium pectorale]
MDPGANSSFPADSPLVVMVLDVEEGPSGSFYIWGRTSGGATVLVQVHDYCPYLYVAAPQRTAPAAAAAGGDGGAQGGGDGGGAATPGGSGTADAQWSAQELESLRQHWNSRLPPDCRIASLAPVLSRPIMYYRPAAPAGQPFLRASLRPGGPAKRAGAALAGLMGGREAAAAEGLLGMRFVDRTVYEAEIVRAAEGSGGSDAVGEPAASAASAAAAAALPPALAAAVLAARHGAIAPLTIMTVDVLAVPYDGANRTPVTSKDDPVVCIACDVRKYGTGVAAAAVTGAPGTVAGGSDGNGGSGGERAAPSRVVFMVAASEAPIPR